MVHRHSKEERRHNNPALDPLYCRSLPPSHLSESQPERPRRCYRSSHMYSRRSGTDGTRKSNPRLLPSNPPRNGFGLFPHNPPSTGRDYRPSRRPVTDHSLALNNHQDDLPSTIPRIPLRLCNRLNHRRILPLTNTSSTQVHPARPLRPNVLNWYCHSSQPSLHTDRILLRIILNLLRYRNALSLSRKRKNRRSVKIHLRALVLTPTQFLIIRSLE